MKKLATAALFLVPAFAFAQQLTNIQTFLTSIGRLVNTALPIVVGIALLAFFWGLARFIFQAGDDEKRKEAKHMMIWSVIAFFVMVSIWGLVNFLGNALGIQQGQNAPNIPTVPGLGR